MTDSSSPSFADALAEIDGALLHVRARADVESGAEYERLLSIGEGLHALRAWLRCDEFHRKVSLNKARAGFPGRLAGKV